MTLVDTWAQMILDAMGIDANIEDVLSEIIGENYGSSIMSKWPERAAQNSYFIDSDFWNRESISTVVYPTLRSLFKQYKEKHNL